MKQSSGYAWVSYIIYKNGMNAFRGVASAFQRHNGRGQSRKFVCGSISNQDLKACVTVP